ncbi:hypothetical protein OEA41_004069 [Lepraria neglecta]|uniref:Uncharacterized protein n=1 Tax=Lepraria neglecta TaxID=209136 RepID=A0AAE0DJT5_9LECA|nr:hypothetical protein OEA41_004069 [Lepraria neglecta]
MCWRCEEEEEDEPTCSYCGGSCFGSCGNPDVCSCCWFYKNSSSPWDEVDDDEDLDECIETGCNCKCHEDVYDTLGIRFEAGVRYDRDEDGPPYERKGVFRFLSLPGEIREKIYGFAFLQDGERRKSQFHRGTIHTSLLRTCRQVYKEAANLPLTLNKLSFNSPLFALDFLGFHLSPSQRHLVTGMHVEHHISEFGVSSWQLLIRELVKMPLTHLGLTVMGGYHKESLLDHHCFTCRFKKLKQLKSFDLVLGSGMITKADKDDLVEEMRTRLIKGYIRPQKAKTSKNKRAATSDSDTKPKTPSKKAKKGHGKPKYQAKIVRSTKTSRLGLKSGMAEHQAAEAATQRAKLFLLGQYDQLKQYAISLDYDAAPVKIRLEEARQAAEVIDEAKFEKVAHGIFLTLEERYNKIANARNEVPRFETPATTPEPSASQESSTLLDTQHLSQLSC